MTIRKPLAVASLGALLVASVAAVAQTTTPAAPAAPAAQPAPMVVAPAAPATAAGLREIKDEKRVVAPWNLSVDKIKDMNVYAPDGSKIGEVDKVLEDASGQATAAVVEFGGFLGIGETEVVVPLAQLSVSGEKLTTALTKEQIKAMPRWKS
ncbi:MAG: PRC-barrel domain-containing protein [Alphaproteobacteria bacterium]